MKISVVVPTFERNDLMIRAVRSALVQTLAPFEVIVVIDGVDDAAVAALDALDEPEVRTVVAGARLGNAAARNLGIARARGDWIALLDDDDLWTPDKLERQCEALGGTGASRDGLGVPVVSCRLNAVAGERRFVWPRLLPRRGERVAHYLFCRRWPLTGDRILQTSTLLAPRSLFLAVPFRDGRRFVDQDWLLRADHGHEVRLVFPSRREALVDWDIDPSRRRVSHYRDWRRCVAWARRRHHLLDARAHPAFLLTLASASAADAGEHAAFWPLLREAWRSGRPGPAELLTHVANFALSRRVRDRVAVGANRWLGS